MRINKVDNILQIYNKNTGIKKTKTESKEKDQLKISEKAMDFQYAIQKLKDVEDIRMDKVEDIKARVNAGTYDIKGKEIAEKIFENINFNKRI